MDASGNKSEREAPREEDRRKDEFLAMLAHELRNPIAPIRNALSIVRLGVQDKRPDLQQAYSLMERQLEHLVRLVDDLLDASRITRGKIPLRREPADVALVVERAVEAARPQIDARRHTLEVRLPGEPLRVEADVTRLAQVLLNLLNNSAKYTPEGGRITLTAERRGEEAVIRVGDNGVGIPADVLPHVFDLFTQADRTLDRAEGGLGLGLTLVRRLTEMHGGTAEAHSAGPGRGSEFVVRLPLLRGAAAGAAGPAAAAPPEPPPPPPARILVVDDNADSAESLAMLLRMLGHEVRTAGDGPRALAAAAAFRPGVVVCDIGLPGLNGYEVARQLRADPAQAGVFLVALTGYGSEEDRRRALEAGFNEHMVKPAEIAGLQKLLAWASRPPV